MIMQGILLQAQSMQIQQAGVARKAVISLLRGILKKEHWNFSRSI